MTTLIQTQTMTSAAKSWLSDTVRDLRQYARETLAQCETETWRDGAGQRPGGRWTEPESASDRLFSQKGWNSVDSGFKLF